MTHNCYKNNRIALGCIADDITGASDLGLMLASNGLPTTLFLGVPEENAVIETPCVVIALKIRTVPAGDAVDRATEAANWLIARKARQLFYKYCSTFDSTSKGNIGPVSDALLTAVGADLTVLLPAFPENGRTVRDGNLLVHGLPLSDSSMRNHPLTPMTESFIPALMDGQTAPGLTGYISSAELEKGADGIRARLAECRTAGNRYVSIDSSTSEDLAVVAEAISDLKLITGGSGIGEAIPGVLRRNQLIDLHQEQAEMPVLGGNAAILAGSCSTATKVQIREFAAKEDQIVVDPIALGDGLSSKESLAEKAVAASRSGDVLICSTTDTDRLAEVQKTMGVEESAQLVEDALAHVARKLMDSGVRKFVIAGGETSGAVAKALDVQELIIGTQIDPGVPWMIANGSDPTCLAFKSGNFGRPNFFKHALDLLP